MTPVKVFVAEHGNEFMRDIADNLVEAARLAGRDASLQTTALPTVDGAINLVVAPHEYFLLTDASPADLQRAAAASVCVCTEQPNTPWFHISLDACGRGLLALDINAHGVEALRAKGISAQRLQFGATPSMRAPDAPERDIDVLFMGSLDPRRGRALAGLAPLLWNRRAEVRTFPFDKPVSASTPGMVFGSAKHELLSRAALLVNVHRDRTIHLPTGAPPPAYFEWVRMVEAMANGCVVVSEPADGCAPLRAGEHFVTAGIAELPAVVAELLGDEARRTAIAERARDAVTGDLALATSLDAALRHIDATVMPQIAAHVASGAHRRGPWRLNQRGVRGPVVLPAFRPFADVLRRAKHVVLESNAALQRLEAIQAMLRHADVQHMDHIATPAHTAAVAAGKTPEVSVLVSLYNYEALVTETLDSILASDGISIEVIIVEDHATDDSRAVAAQYLDRHPDVPMLLVAKDVNEGLAAARNTGIAHCRAPLVMIMDADNLVYPTCLRRMADALAADEGADFAYAALEEFGSAANVRSAFAWNPAWLCSANYIDAQSMIRREVLQAMGGYRTDDPLVFGWEDWELWLRIATAGRRGVLVPEMLGRYRVQAGSMIGLTNLAVEDSLAHLRVLHPTLPWPTLDDEA